MSFACNLNGSLSWQPEKNESPASVGRVCAWGAFTVAEISSEVPEGERDEYARRFAASEDLEAALEECLIDLVGYQVNARMAAKDDDAWEGVAEAIQPRIDAGRDALSKARGERS